MRLVVVRPARIKTATIVAVVLLTGCARKQPAASTAPAAKPVTRTATRGPVAVTVELDKDRITIAEKLHWTITAEAEDGVDVQMPPFAKDLADLAVRDFATESALPTPDGRRRWRQRYELDSLVSGRYRLPEVKVTFTDRRETTLARHGGKPVTGELVVEPIEVTITSLLDGQFDPKNFRDIKPPVELAEPASHAWLWWAGGAVAALAGLVGLIVLIRRLRRRRRPSVTVPAHEWAFAQLQRLIDDDLIGAGDVRGFYFRLTDIVRIYIERRFRLAAPEQTTEEFLETLRGSDTLAVEHKRRLGEFLQAADLVKFARYQPGKDQIEQAFNAARDFIEQTAERAKPASPQGSGEQAA